MSWSQFSELFESIGHFVVSRNDGLPLKMVVYSLNCLEGIHVLENIVAVEKFETDIDQHFEHWLDLHKFHVKTFQYLVTLELVQFISLLFLGSFTNVSISTCLSHLQSEKFLLEGYTIHLN